ncbi:MAG TPA: 2,3,4,5-tetrahydropyridine-2,6-dicarboxylate N-succinyltransferase, partial [Acidimicrobiia bacterium]|nr:2,3,4,5-tetrahydropyridine-2,6-dicarboxylate N-succinyltransferase [Acidimicrobiia bacterium]
MTDDRVLIEEAYRDLDRLDVAAEAVERTIARLDAGEVRVAEKLDGEWVVNEWVKEAILLYFRLATLQVMDAGPL